MREGKVVRLLSVLFLGALFGLGLSAAGADEPTPAVPSPAVSVPLPAPLTAPAGETCIAVENPLSWTTVSQCSGCSFFPPDWCTNNCCGSTGVCIDDESGGYCVC